MSATQSLELVHQQAPPKSVEDLIQVAIEKGVDVGVLERLMVIRKEVNGEKAKAAFMDALASFQAECPTIKKTKSGARDAYKYAPLDDIVAQVKELLLKHGFCHQTDAAIEAGWVKAICTVTHRLGHSETKEFKVPIDSRNNMMNDPQKYAGSMTFAKRYAFCNALGIMTGDEDNDGAGKPKPAGPAAATPKTRLWMIEQLHDIEQQALAYAIDNRLILPNETLAAWPLSDVPATKPELAALRQEILKHQ